MASIPVLKAPLAIAFVTHGFLYHGVGGAALMVSSLFAVSTLKSSDSTSVRSASLRNK